MKTQKFKVGDILHNEQDNETIIFKEKIGDTFYCFASYDKGEIRIGDDCYGYGGNFRIATLGQCLTIWGQLASINKKWNSETNQVETLNPYYFQMFGRGERISTSRIGSHLYINREPIETNYPKEGCYAKTINYDRQMFVLFGKVENDEYIIRCGIIKDCSKTAYIPIKNNIRCNMKPNFEILSLSSFQSELSIIGYEFNPETNEFKKKENLVDKMSGYERRIDGLVDEIEVLTNDLRIANRCKNKYKEAMLKMKDLLETV